MPRPSRPGLFCSPLSGLNWSYLSLSGIGVFRPLQLSALDEINAHFTCATLWQEDEKWGRLVENVFVKEADSERSSGHGKKSITLIGDRNGSNKSDCSNKTMYEQVADALEKEGWDVMISPSNMNPGHKDKHRDINKVLGEKDEEAVEWAVRIDEEKCQSTIVSIENSPI